MPSVFTLYLGNSSLSISLKPISGRPVSRVKPPENLDLHIRHIFPLDILNHGLQALQHGFADLHPPNYPSYSRITQGGGFP